MFFFFLVKTYNNGKPHTLGESEHNLQNILQNGLERIAKMQNLSQNELEKITKMHNLSQNEL